MSSQHLSGWTYNMKIFSQNNGLLGWDSNLQAPKYEFQPVDMDI
jgi:hypothetical protein